MHARLESLNISPAKFISIMDKNGGYATFQVARIGTLLYVHLCVSCMCEPRLTRRVVYVADGPAPIVPSPLLVPRSAALRDAFPTPALLLA